MKVTVSFDAVRVVVPCGDGQMLVSDLIGQAVARYSKVLGKTAEFGSHITVHYLKSADGGILDPDDSLVDVVDDKDQLNASFEMAGDSLSPPSSGTELRQHGAGDGTSTCGSPSEGACGGLSSPGVVGGFTAATFLKAAEQGGIIRVPSHQRDLLEDDDDLSILDSIAFPTTLKSGSRVEFIETTIRVPPSPFKDDASITTETEFDGDHSNANYDDECDDDVKNLQFLKFVRDPTRKSLTNNAAVFRWVDAQERLQEKYEDEQFRKEPLGSSDETTSAPQDKDQKDLQTHSDKLHPSSSSQREVLIVLVNPQSPLGIHVIPGFDDLRRNTGLVIHSIEPNSTIAKDGRLHINDRIVEVNGSSLFGLEFSRAQEVFKSALQSSTVRLRVVSASSSTPQSSTHLLPVSAAATTSSSRGSTAVDATRPLDSGLIHQRAQSSGGDVAKSTPAKVRPAVPERTTSAGIRKPKFAPIMSTRLIGNVMGIDLVKGSQGLGFSVTSRDNPAGDDSPIYVKNILPQGAAVSDGRLLPGDRLLQVNGVDMSGKSQEDVVTMLRCVHIGDSVSLVISRNVSNDVIKTDNDDVKTVRESPPGNSPASSRSSSKDIDEHLAGNAENNDETEYIALSIPIMQQNEGEQRPSLLGASIKGKTMSIESGSRDLGLFVKAIIEGSAADKDGRLMPDDRLIELNGVSLVGQSNSETMKTLRHALRSRGPSPDYVDLVVARRQMAATSGGSPDHGVWESTPSKVRHEAMSSSLSTGARLSGGKSTTSKQGSVLRNMSYHMANGDMSVSVARSLEGVADSSSHLASTSSVGLAAPTLYGRRCDTFLIETEEGTSSSFRSTSSGTSANSSRSSKSDQQTWNKRTRLKKNSSQDIATTVATTLEIGLSHDATVESSEFSPVDVVPVVKFSREGLGRQSMSEKRKGHLDPRVTAFYQQVKQAKENLNKLELNQSNGDKNKANYSGETSQDYTSKLYRCCSLESVTMAMNDLTQKVHQPPISSTPKIQRNRGCNESFRAAVDRSYARGKESENSDVVKDQSQFTNIDDEFYDERRNGKKQKSLLKAFGDVFKIGKPKSGNSEKDKAERAYSLRDAETQREIENNLKNVSLSKPNSRAINELSNGVQAASSPRTSRQRVFQSAVGYADSCNSLPHQWSSPEYAVLAPHRGNTATVPPYENKFSAPQVNNLSRVQTRMTSSNLPHAVSTLNISSQPSQREIYRQTGRTTTQPVNGLPADEFRSNRALPTDVYYTSTPSLHHLHKRQSPPGSFTYQHQGQASKLMQRQAEVAFSSQLNVLRPTNGSSRFDRTPNNLSGTVTSRPHTDGLAVAGNPVTVNGTVYKFSLPANV